MLPNLLLRGQVTEKLTAAARRQKRRLNFAIYIEIFRWKARYSCSKMLWLGSCTESSAIGEV
jgi:hypothetical protein